MDKAFLNWSSGKDAALALYLMQSEQKLNISSLVTTINEQAARVPMHGLRKSLLLEQARAIGLPLHEIALPAAVGMKSYAKMVENTFKDLKNQGINHAVYGDIFLEDLREYREKSLRKVSITSHYPLWKKDTKKLSRQIVDLGFKAITVAVSDKKLGVEYCGNSYDHDFLDRLPKGIDPCGENGEFHTFVYDGPIFNRPVMFDLGPCTKHDLSLDKDQNTSWESVFWYCDLH